MFYRNELSFLCEVFKKSHIPTHVVELSELQQSAQSDAPEGVEQSALFGEILSSLLPRTVYRFTDAFEFCYRLLLLPDTEVATVFYIGPFLSAPLSQKQIFELGEKNGISPQKQRHLSEYYSGLPVLGADSQLLIMFNTFCERIWQSPSFAIQDVTRSHVPDDAPISQSMQNPDLGDTLVSIKTMERRYAFENEMIRSVSLGQPHMERQFDSAFSSRFFEDRLSDPLRNAKNYGIIMNTLLRKAAEKGGVHPIHLDRISSTFANKIERLSSLAENPALMREMFRTYCRLVRKHSLQHFSPLVQKTILLIDADLSADLSAGALAQKQEVSLGYLSTLFKKETNRTISAYIREKRMEYAAYLLSTTDLQIQTVALHCGILDVQYFSKLFKQHWELTPSQYRQSRREAAQV